MSRLSAVCCSSSSKNAKKGPRGFFFFRRIDIMAANCWLDLRQLGLQRRNLFFQFVDLGLLTRYSIALLGSSRLALFGGTALLAVAATTTGPNRLGCSTNSTRIVFQVAIEGRWRGHPHNKNSSTRCRNKWRSWDTKYHGAGVFLQSQRQGLTHSRSR